MSIAGVRALTAPYSTNLRPVGHTVTGPVDGAPIVLACGIVIERDSVDGRHVSDDELAAAIHAIELLPEADRAIVARAGVIIHLLPVRLLEDNLLGATLIVRSGTSTNWTPKNVRVAAAAGRAGAESTAEIVQHEIGHAVSVLTRNDPSEDAAEAYARAH